ncbi:probable protein phosphatase 2C 72 [Solanum lycopersicum]|uniref:PPM-type phosphatase domain-containing protein n=1 Tax=Solanum lycopersicum TaxID=4081 RepID=A0A3Q7HQJ8_SOLLC|nr:probable protein phosphatase 2C 72 [Solanum lycopersicum]
MGICGLVSCISSTSFEIQPVDFGNENVVHYDDNNINENQCVIGSVFSQQGNKGINQDSAILYQGYGVENGVFGGVFDGHGKNGQVVSKFVMNKLPSLLLKCILSLPKITSPKQNVKHVDEELVKNKNFDKWKDACLNSFKVMDKDIKSLEKLDCSCSGTTAVVAIRQDDDLIIANLGDSRAVLGRKTEEGVIEAVQLTTDLKPSLPSEAERIRNCDGRVLALKEELHIQRVWLPHEDVPGLAMSRAFGDFMLKNYGIISKPDVSYHHISPNDQFLVLATDGVWDVLSNDQVVSIVCAANNAAAAAEAVVQASLDAWEQKFPNSKRDDSTVICLFLQ